MVARQLELHPQTDQPRCKPTPDKPYAVLEGAASRALATLRKRVRELTGADLGQVSAMAALPGGEGQQLHTDGGQRNLALIIALTDGTAPTRFPTSDTDTARTWAECPAGVPLQAGEAVLFDTGRWHAGPGQPPGAGLRVTLFVPLTGTKRRKGADDKEPHFRSAV